MFKTIEECRLDLVAATMGYDPKGEEDGFDLDDFMPCRAARVSFSNEGKTGQDIEKDKKLMKYLAKHQHMTPFEYQHATFLIECPLFIRSQIHRHRAFSYNEISRRYTDENLKFWIPSSFRGQSKSNRQASDGVVDDQPGLLVGYECQIAEALKTYEWLLEHGVAREQARAVLPQSLLTKFYAGGTLRSWCHFLDLRKDAHAQYEIQVVADRIEKKLRELWPASMEALRGQYVPLDS